MTKIVRAEVRAGNTRYYGNLAGGGRERRTARCPPAEPAAGGGARGSGQAPAPAAEPAAPLAQRRWETFDHRPRFNNNYIGLRNRFALLSEAFAYLTFQDRIVATNRFLDESLTFARTHADRIRKAIEAADRAGSSASGCRSRAEMQNTGTIEVLMGEVSEEKHPVDGHIMNLRKDVKKPETMLDFSTFKGIEPERVPAAYLHPASLTQALDRLRAHGVAVTAAQPRRTWLSKNSASTRATPRPRRSRTTTNGRSPARGSTAERDLPAGTLKVDVSQPLGRLAFYLLEPRSDDGLVDWNLLDEALKDAKMYPIVRTRN